MSSAGAPLRKYPCKILTLVLKVISCGCSKGDLGKHKRGRPRGGNNLPSLSQVLRPFVQNVKSTLLTLRVAIPSGAPRQAPLETMSLAQGGTSAERILAHNLSSELRMVLRRMPLKFAPMFSSLYPLTAVIVFQ